jgi:hypothetical protein
MPHHAASAQPRKSVSACRAHLRRAASHPPPGRIGAQPTTSTAIPCPAASTLSASGPEVGGCGVAPDKRLTLHAVVTEGAGKSAPPPAASRGNCTTEGTEIDPFRSLIWQNWAHRHSRCCCRPWLAGLAGAGPVAARWAGCAELDLAPWLTGSDATPTPWRIATTRGCSARDRCARCVVLLHGHRHCRAGRLPSAARGPPQCATSLHHQHRPAPPRRRRCIGLPQLVSCRGRRTAERVLACLGAARSRWRTRLSATTTAAAPNDSPHAAPKLEDSHDPIRLGTLRPLLGDAPSTLELHLLLR